MTGCRPTDQGVRKLKPRPARYAMPDPELVGHYIMIQPSGVKSCKAIARDPFGKHVWVTVGRCDHLQIEYARTKARAAIARIETEQAARQASPPASSRRPRRIVSATWPRTGSNDTSRRSGCERRAERYIYRAWAERELASIRKSDIAGLLVHVQDNHGPRQAGAVLASVGSVMNWQAARLGSSTLCRSSCRTPLTSRPLAS
jgi:hypothetical protein